MSVLARGLVASMLSVLASGCSINPPLRLSEVAPEGGPVELSEVPFHPQEQYHCGPASLLSALEASGVETAYADVVEKVYVPGLEGSLQVEMKAASRSYGRIAYPLPGSPAALLAEVKAGRPVLVLLNLRLPNKPVWHYALVIGFDPERNQMILHSGREAATRQKARPWLRRWEWAGRWAIVLLRPGEWPAEPDRERLLDALAAFEETAPPEAAGRAWARAAREWPSEPIAWLGVGNAEFRQGDFQAASAAFREALAIEPEHRPARLNLALSLAERGEACEALEVMATAAPVEDAFSGSFEELEGRLRGECAALRKPSG